VSRPPGLVFANTNANRVVLGSRYLPSGLGGPLAGPPDWTLSVIRKHFIPRLGDLQLRKLRPVEIDHMYARWRQDGMAESSARRMHNLLHSALGQAVRWDLIAINPADRIERPQPAKSKRKAPSDDVLRALLDAADEDYACYLRLAASPAPAVASSSHSGGATSTSQPALCCSPGPTPASAGVSPRRPPRPTWTPASPWTLRRSKP
jgi:hypothetical protein